MAARAAPTLLFAAIAACALVGTSVPMPAHARVQAPAPEEQALEVAMAAFDVGLEAYEKGDYARAIESWTSAHRLLVLAVDDVGMQRVLGFDLAQAHLRQHAIDRDPDHLSRARPHLENYILWIQRPGHAPTKAERSDLDHARELLAIVEIDLAAAIGERRSNPYPPGLAPAPPPAIRRDAPSVPPAPDPVRRLRRESTTWLVVGGASLGLGVAFGGAVGVIVREQDEGPSGSGAGLAAAATATVIFSSIGIAALTIGLVKRSAVVRASPTLSKSGFGATMRLAF
jgi:hypothetical protein